MRFVRPSYVHLIVDGRKSEVSTGPRSKFGWLTARLTLRTKSGGVSEQVIIEAGGGGTDAVGELTLGPGLYIDVPKSFTVKIEREHDWEELKGARTIILRPKEDA